MKYVVLYGNGMASQPFNSFTAAKAWAEQHIGAYQWWTISTYFPSAEDRQ